MSTATTTTTISSNTPAATGKEARHSWSIPFIAIALLLSASSFQSYVNTNHIQETRVSITEEGRSLTSSSGIIHLDAKAGNNTKERSDVFVCITGQVQRLELHSKIKTILQPLRNAGYTPYVALMLTNNEHAYFTNEKNKFEPAFSNYTQAHDFLTQQGYHVTTDQPVVQPRNPVVSEDYYKRVGSLAKKVDPESRVKNHARQFHTLTQCGLELLQSSAQNRNYRFAIRIREDTSLTDPLRVNVLYRKLMSTNKAVLAPACRANFGMNDRMALVSPEAAYEYFYAPFMNMYAEPLDESVMNPETYLKTTYQNAGLKVIAAQHLKFVVKLESTSDGSFVLKHGEDKTKCRGSNYGTPLPDHIINDPTATQLLDGQ